MPQMKEIFTVEGQVLRRTEKAILFEFNEEEVWLPVSQLVDAEELPMRGFTEVIMTAWIAKEKGLI